MPRLDLTPAVAAAILAAGVADLARDEEYARWVGRTHPTREELEAGYPGATAAEAAALARSMGEADPFA